MGYCPSCGYENDDRYKFCKKCGSALVSQAVQEPSRRESNMAAPAPSPAPSPSPSPSAGINNFANNLKGRINNQQQSGQAAPLSGFHVTNSYVTWPDNLIALKSIERVKTSIPKPKFPMLLLLLFVIGIAGLMILPLGIIILVICVGWLIYWLVKYFSAPKGVAFFLSSGTVISLYMTDHSAIDNIVFNIEKALNGEDVDYRADVRIEKTQ